MTKRFPIHSDDFCITDIGSTTTKAILFRNDGAWSFHRREAPTTVEKPDEDVRIGVRTALRALEDDTGITLLKDGVPAVPYLSTSSAGGGLAMVVTGLVREVTSLSAERVALGAGAILLDVVAMNDGRTPYEKIQALKNLRPDMILLAGGFDGEAISGPVYLAELILEAGLRPKLSKSADLPVVYAGNTHAVDLVRETLGEGFLFHPVPNIRPGSNLENLEPARHAIHDLFMGHVMSHAPGYEGLTSWVDSPILPTPSAFGKILALASREWKAKILAIDIGGATTDVFTAESGRVSRTVSANLGMSYSILNVIKAAGIEAVEELLDIEVARERLWDRIGNKHLRPTRLPVSTEEVLIEQSVGSVAIREAVKEHLQVLAGLSLSRSQDELAIRKRFISSRPGRRQATDGPFALTGYDVIIGSGGILSHSPRDAAAMMLFRALNPKESVELAVDSAFMFPHLGVLSDLAPEVALRLFRELGLVRLGSFPPGQDHEKRTSPATNLKRTPPASDVPSREKDRISREPIRLRRELAIPGETFVTVGERVASNTLIARSSRQFLRPFFLDVRSVLRVEPGEVPGCLLKGVGDDVSNGEVIARKKGPLLTSREYHSTVEGRIERILPSGTVVLREKPEIATELTAVTVAKDLRMRPEQIKPYVRVDVGANVERGQAIAAMMRPDDMRKSLSPVRGKVKGIDYAYGIVMIEPLLEELEVRAWMPGIVEEVSDRGALVVNQGMQIEGIWGFGGEVHGALGFHETGPGRILVKDFATREDLSQIQVNRGAGLIVGGLHLADLLAQQVTYTIVVTGGFGKGMLSAELRDVLQEHDGRFALLDGTTEVRVGVKRPRIILPAGG